MNSLEPGGTRYEDGDDDEGEPVFLGPDVEFNEDARKFVLDNFDYFFEFYLEQWWLDEAHWPAPRTREMFLDWFEITISSMVEDVVDGPLTAE